MNIAKKKTQLWQCRPNYKCVYCANSFLGCYLLPFKKKKSTRLAMLRTSKCPIPPHFQVVFKLIAGGGQNDRFNRFSKNKTSKYKRQFPK